MAKMIPSAIENQGIGSSRGERKLFDLFAGISDEYYVFHSLEIDKSPSQGFKRHIRERQDFCESDFMVAHPRKGILLIEVKDGTIEYKNRAWVQNGRTLTKNPLKQVNESVYPVRSMVSSLHLNHFVGQALCFSEMPHHNTDYQLPPELNEHSIIWEESLYNCQALESTIDAIFQSFESRYSYRPLTPKCISNFPKFIDRLAPEMGCMKDLNSPDLFFYRSTVEQQRLLDIADGIRHMAISGYAGTGKTVIAQEKARRLSKTGKVLFLCFNRFLADALKDSFTAFPEIDVFTEASFYSSIRRPTDPIHKDAKLPSVRTPVYQRWATSQTGENHSYTHVVIDEAQDLSPDTLQVFLRMVTRFKGSFYLFYDKHQFVHVFEEVSQEELGALTELEYAQEKFNDFISQLECKFPLKKICRCKKSIAQSFLTPFDVDLTEVTTIFDESSELVTPPIPVATVPAPVFVASPVSTSTTLDYKRPTIIYSRDTADTIDLLTSLLQQAIASHLPKNRIAVLTCTDEYSTLLQSKLEQKVYRLSPTLALHKEVSPNEIIFTSTRKFKGLEADLVILIDFNETIFDKSKDKDGKNRFYVGASRAKTTLLTIYTLPPNTTAEESIVPTSLITSQGQPPLSGNLDDFLSLLEKK